MKKMLIGVLVLTVLISASLLITNIANTTTGGPPAGKTGAPGEGLCVNCHFVSTLNTGPGNLGIIFPGQENGYIPGETYTIKVRIAQNGVSRFGFQAVVLANLDFKDCGNLAITDPVRTQFVYGNDRTYVEHTYSGVASQGESSFWEFQWTAPDYDIGAVTIYAASVGVEDNMPASDAFVYATSLSILGPSGLEDNRCPGGICGYDGAVFHVSEGSAIFASAEQGTGQFAIYDLGGRQVLKKKVKIIEGKNYIPVDFPSVSKSIYICTMSMGNEVWNTKYMKR